MSVYNDMASDAGYKYGTRENEQMAQMIEQQEQEEMYRQHQMQAEAMAHARAQEEYEQGEATMTEKQMTDGEYTISPLDQLLINAFKMGASTGIRGSYTVPVENWLPNFKDANKKLIKEARKGMFTEDDMRAVFNAFSEGVLMNEFDKWLTERKGR